MTTCFVQLILHSSHSILYHVPYLSSWSTKRTSDKFPSIFQKLDTSHSHEGFTTGRREVSYNWVVNFASERKHANKPLREYLLTKSTKLINSNVMQWFQVGPVTYDAVASDLQSVHQRNKFIKYADDNYLLVGAAMTIAMREELLACVAELAENDNFAFNTISVVRCWSPDGYCRASVIYYKCVTTISGLVGQSTGLSAS